MNALNEKVRIMRTTVSQIDKILETEHIDYKKGEELRNKRDAYQEELNRLLPLMV